MIFERALRRELTSTAGAVLTTLFTITITVMLIRILGQAAAGEIASRDVIELIGFEAIKLLPVILILTGFVAVLLVMTRNYQDSEMVVWFASGLSLADWIKPVLIFAVPIIAMTALLSFAVTPWAQRQSVEFRERFQQREDISRVSPGKFQESPSANRVFFVEGISGDSTHVRNVFINTVAPDGRASVVVAKEGTVERNPRGDKFVVMEKGRRYDGLPGQANFDMMEFQRYTALVATQSQMLAASIATSSLPTRILLSERTNANLAELMWRCSLPLMSLLMILLAIPLAFVNPRGGRSANLVVALLLFVVYNDMVSVFQAMIAQGRLSFAVAAWPMHLLAILMIALMFAWRLNVNSRYHPSAILSALGNARIARRRKEAS